VKKEVHVAMSDDESVAEPVVDGELSPDGRFRWDGARWVDATTASGTGYEPALVVSPRDREVIRKEAGPRSTVSTANPGGM
jgi:hypothetical protein